MLVELLFRGQQAQLLPNSFFGFCSEQPERVGDDNKGCARIRENRQPKASVAQQRQNEEDSFHAESENDVRLNDADGSPAKLNRLGHFT